MLYTELTRKAMITAYNAHQGQTDKSGVPYIFHPFSVAERVSEQGGDEYAVCAALLHDVVEDTKVSFSDLEKDYPERVMDVLRLLTHEQGQSYEEYLLNIKNEPDRGIRDMALFVKCADLWHNMNESRVEGVAQVNEKQLSYWREKYKKAGEILGLD